jgi:Na+/proline symporter
MSEKKQTSYKILMGLIVLMFALQTIRNGCKWCIVWLGFIYYGDTPDKALDALEYDGAMRMVRIAASSSALLGALSLAIADSIMVSTHLSLPANTDNSLWFEGLEVLDHMRQELDGSSRSSIFQSWVYR